MNQYTTPYILPHFVDECLSIRLLEVDCLSGYSKLHAQNPLSYMALERKEPMMNICTC
jgi:hypothetical protein